MTCGFGWIAWRTSKGGGHHHDHSHGGALDRVLFWLALLAWGWLIGGLMLNLIV